MQWKGSRTLLVDHAVDRGETAELLQSRSYRRQIPDNLFRVFLREEDTAADLWILRTERPAHRAHTVGGDGPFDEVSSCLHAIDGSQLSGIPHGRGQGKYKIATFVKLSDPSICRFDLGWGEDVAHFENGGGVERRARDIENAGDNLHKATGTRVPHEFDV